MKIKTLTDFIENVDPEKIAFISKNIFFTYSDLIALKQKNAEKLDYLKNKRVVIKSVSRLDFALLCFLLDGVAQVILFLPADIPDELFDKYIDEAQITESIFLQDKVLKTELIKGNYFNNDVVHFDETLWIIPTSGTTNIPKLIPHTLSSLTRTTKTNLEVGAKFVWGLIYDIYRFAGLQVFLQSMVSGSTLVITEEGESIEEILTFLQKNSCNALSATPSFWRKFCMSDSLQILKLKVITLGGEIVDDTILNFLKKIFPNAKILHIYASTEAGVGFSVSDCKAGFPVAYLGDEKRKMYIDDNDVLFLYNAAKNQYINTGDIVKIANDRVVFLGRDSGSINVGGNKVLPEEVEAVILQSGFVSAVLVYAKKNSILGNMVSGDVVLKSEYIKNDNIKKEILNFCKSKLQKFKVPVTLKIVDDINVTSSGKIKR